MAAQLIAHYTPSEQITPNFYNHFTPVAAKIFPHLTPSEQITASLLHNFTPPPWQPNSYIILSPLNKLPPHTYTILPPLATQLLHLFTLSEQFTPSLLRHFIPFGRSTLTSFYPLWTIYPLTLTPFYHPCQLNSIIILPPQSYIVLAPIIDECKSWTHDFFTLSWFSFISRTPKLVQLLKVYIYESKLLELTLWRNYPLTLTSIYPLRTNEPQTLTSF